MGFTHATVMVFATGVTQALYNWGSALLAVSGKGREAASSGKIQ